MPKTPLRPNTPQAPLTPYARWQTRRLHQALAQRRVVILAGPRQSGKTTLAKSYAHGQNTERNTATNTHPAPPIYRTLDDPSLLNAALSDPKGFVRHGNELMVIDEVQRAPILLQAIKQDVDEHQQPGRFLLTGSAAIQSLPNVNESLAGRVSTVRLRPLALGEIAGVPPHFLEKAFAQNFSAHSSFSAKASPNPGAAKATRKTPALPPGPWDKDTIIQQALQGGFPEARRQRHELDQRAWHQDYVQALIERDLQDIAHIKRQDAMAKLIEALAAWSSKFMDVASLCTGLGLSRPTVESYINALEALYLVERLRPWHKTDYDRVGKRDKIFMTDTGLMAAMLRWRFAKVRLDGDMNGKLLETLVFTQLAAQVDTQVNTHPHHQYQLYHYRDGEQREVDFVLERDDGAVLGIEVKASALVDKAMFKHLSWFSKTMVPGQDFVGVVLYTGEHVLPFGPKLWAVPMHALWA